MVTASYFFTKKGIASIIGLSILILIIVSAVILYFETIRPFPDDPANHIEELRLNHEINAFYNMYEEYGVSVYDGTESKISISFSAADDDRQTSLRVNFFNGEPYKFTYICSESMKRVFTENTVKINCFDS